MTCSILPGELAPNFFLYYRVFVFPNFLQATTARYEDFPVMVPIDTRLVVDRFSLSIFGLPIPNTGSMHAADHT